MTLKNLQSTRNPSDLAKLLGYKPSTISFIIYKIPENYKYAEFTIPKSGGGFRKITAPKNRLKLLQHRLADLLQRCYEEILGADTNRRALSHGYRKNCSIITNARNHVKKRYVFNIDLKDFFPSINFGRVRGYFIKSRDFQLDPRVATVIAQIMCYKNSLPQGSPVSPVMSNLIGHILDIRLVQLSKKAGCSYSRYVDDITFSTNKKEFPSLIASQDSAGVWNPSEKLIKIIKRAGFDINLQKVSMQYRTNQQIATGLVVNKKVNIRASYYRQARAMCHSLFQSGEFYFGKEFKRSKISDGNALIYGNINQLRGILHYIYSVKRLHDEHTEVEQKRKSTSIQKLCRRFHYYEKFHNLQLPLVICEGETDVIYLKCALKSNSDEFPSLIEVSESELKWNIDFFKYSKFNKELLNISGGTGAFIEFINKYEKRMQRFLTPGCAFPVILLIDNDKGARKIKNNIATRLNRQYTTYRRGEYCNIVKNLYLVVIPLLDGKCETSIEDYFDNSTRSTPINGKKFNPNEKKFDKNFDIGKKIFAEKIVKVNQDSIDFSNFKPLLRLLAKVIAGHPMKINN